MVADYQLCPFNNRSLNCDGVNFHFATAPQNANADGFTNATWSFWVKRQQNGDPGGETYLYCKYDPNTGGSWACTKTDDFGSWSDIRIRWITGGAFNTFATNPAPVVGVWHHFAFVHIGATIFAYQNGVLLVERGPHAPVNPVPTSTSVIGFGAQGNGINPSLCRLSNCSLFNTGMTQLQVQNNLYNSGVPPDLTGLTGLVSWWTFNGVGTDFADSNSTTTNTATFAFDSPGGNQYVNLTNQGDLAGLSHASWSVAASITAGLPTGTYQLAAKSAQWSLAVTVSGGNYFFVAYVGAGGTQLIWTSASNPFTLATTHVFGIAYDGTLAGNTKLKAYIDGVDITAGGAYTGTGQPATLPASANIVAAASTDGTTGFWPNTGDINDLAWWTTSASLAQMAEVATAGTSQWTTTSLGAPLHYYTWDGQNANDSGSSPINGTTPNGMTYCFIPPVVPPAVLAFSPASDTIRGGATIFANIGPPAIDSTAEDRTLTAAPDQWTPTGTILYSPSGATFSAGASLARAGGLAFFDAAVDVALGMPENVVLATGAAPVAVAILRHDVGGSSVVLEVDRGPSALLRVRATLTTAAQTIVGGIVPFDSNTTLRIVRDRARVYVFACTRIGRLYSSLTPLLATNQFVNGTGSITLAVGTSPVSVATTFSNFTFESHMRIGERLVDNKAVRFSRIIGTVPAATTPEVDALEDVAVFGLFGEGLLPASFQYVYPPKRTLASNAFTVQDVVLKDGS